MNSYWLKGRRVRLEASRKLGSGGQADVYGYGDLALKIFHQPPTELAEKLRAFPKSLPAAVVAPTCLVEDAEQNPVGYAMRRLRGAFPMSHLMRRSWRLGRLNNHDVMGLFRQLHDLLAHLHQRGIVVGDLNARNVMLEPKGRRFEIALIDADSMQFSGYPCPVAHPRILAPELFGRDLSSAPLFSAQTDGYAFQALLFEALLFVHPYGGTHPTHHTFEQRAHHHISCLRAEVKKPKCAADFQSLPLALRDVFERTFDAGDRSPFDGGLLDLTWRRCDSCGLDHARADCPACRSASMSQNRPEKSAARRSGRVICRTVIHVPRGAVIAAASRNGRLRYLVDDGDRLVREDGTRVANGRVEPGMMAALGATTTWLGLSGRLIGVHHERSHDLAERCQSETYEGHTVFGVMGNDLVRMAGDQLIHHQRGTYIGAVIAGQTWLHVGPSLVAGVYRAGRVMHGFIGRLDAPGLRTLSMPHPIRGQRLVGIDVASNGSVVVFDLQWEQGPRRCRVLEVFAANGRQLGRWDGLEGSPGGICLTPHALLVPTDEGIMRLRLDERGLSDPVVFDDTEPFVTAASRLLAGSDRSLFVVGDDRINHLRIH